jgi:hypothetical protein
VESWYGVAAAAAKTRTWVKCAGAVRASEGDAAEGPKVVDGLAGRMRDGELKQLSRLSPHCLAGSSVGTVGSLE